MKRLKEKIGFIGCGNMGSAILEGLLKNKIARPNQILVHDPAHRRMFLLRKRFSVRTCSSNAEVVKGAQLIVLAIKPQELKEVLLPLRPLFQSHTIISILAGTPLIKLRNLIGLKSAIVRAMPNLGAKVGESITALTGHLRGLQKAELVFSGCGETIRVREKYFDLVTAVSGSGPAYFFLLMELLANFAQEKGLPFEQANHLAVQTALGSGKLAKLAHLDPERLRKQVTSKMGTTEAALSVLFDAGIESIFKQAFAKAVWRAQEMSRFTS
ncbi:MAG: pyrroline-5-carboxylate reductase [Candidatus Omnitrophica bacterium]|nr:pyrroline-5-carboxylate reductase [Candidatus Omnitrophota bacterium]